MILPLHILIALASIVVATYGYISPSTNKLRASYGLIGLTLASGIILVVSTRGHLVQACMSGIVYVGTVTLMVAMTRHKLASTN